MTQETRTYKITGLTPVLGSLPASEELYTQFIASKDPKANKDEAEDFIQMEEKGLTVFPRMPNGNEIIMVDYQLKGFFKEAINNLKADNGVAAGRKKVDNFIFIGPRFIPIMKDGKPIVDEDGRLERPLRASTMQGERVSLASSEVIDTPWELEFTVTLLKDGGTKASKPLSWDIVEEALDYGNFKGLGQWRNGGYGRFAWELVSSSEEAA